MNLFLNNIKDKNVLQISHNDLDGIGSIILGKYYLESIVKKLSLLSCDYDSIEIIDINTFKDYDIIIFTDITPTVLLYKKLIELNKIIYIFDHHQSAYNELMNIIPEEYYNYDINRCGTQIFFDKINENRRTSKCIYQFVELVNTYDTWQESSILWKDGKALHNILWGSMNWSTTDNLLKYKKFIDNQLEKFNKGKIFYFTQYEERLAKSALDKEKENLIFAKKNLQLRKDSEGNNYAYFECSSKISIVANMLLKEFSDLQYICGHSTYNDKNGVYEPSVSLRSIGATDVSIIAGIYDGGGHKNSAGVIFKDYNFFIKFRKGELHLI